MSSRNAVFETITRILRAEAPAVQGAWVFGSRATGTARPDSDLDLALLLAPGESLSTAQRIQLASRIGTETGLDTDISVLDAARDTILAFEVVSRGLRLFAASPAGADELEARIYSMYYDFREEMAPVYEAWSAGASHG